MSSQLRFKYLTLFFTSFFLIQTDGRSQTLEKFVIDQFPLEAIELGDGKHGVILVHGAAVNADYFFGKYSNQFGQQLMSKGFRVIGIKWNHPDSLFGMKSIDAAIKKLTMQGVEKISLIGHSRGGELIANFYRQTSGAMNINSLIQIDSVDDQPISDSKVKKLFVYSRNSSYARWQPGAFQKSAEPKEQIVVSGSDHNVAKIMDRQPNLIDAIATFLQK